MFHGFCFLHGFCVLFFENALQTGGIWKLWLFVFVWTEHFLKTGLSEDGGATIIIWSPWQSFLKHKSKKAGDYCVSDSSVVLSTGPQMTQMAAHKLVFRVVIRALYISCLELPLGGMFFWEISDSIWFIWN